MVEKWIEGFITVAVNEGLITEKDKRIAVYGLVWAYHVLSTLAAIALTGVVLGVPAITLAAAATSGIVRFVSGGAHFASSLKCVLFSAVVFNIHALIGKAVAPLIDMPRFYEGAIITAFVAVTLAWGVRVVDAFVPVDTAQRPIGTLQERQRFRILSYAAVFLVTVVFIILTCFVRAWDYALAIWLAYSLQIFSLTPQGGRLFRRVDLRL